MTDLLRQTAEYASARPLVATVIATAIAGVAWTVSDYYAWIAFGTGGTPPTPAGYWRMTKIRVQHALSNNDLLDPSPLSKDGPSYIKAPLRQREGARPKIQSRTMPQRQHPEQISDAARNRLHSLMDDIAKENPDLLEVKLSHTEGKTTDGLYAKPDTPNLNPIAKDKILNHEIAHAHPADNSLHVWLSDRDARKVIAAGWGQRFPLTFVKQGWTMVYAPRDETEFGTVERIVRAGVAYITRIEKNIF